jgi:hypothetical protein
VKDKSQQFFPSLSNIPLYLLKLTHPSAILLPNSVCKINLRNTVYGGVKQISFN